MTRKLKVLIAEDNPRDVQFLVRELRRAEFEPEWHCVETEADYLAKLDPNLDLIISDYEMPEFSGLRALELLKQRPGLEIPFIIVSGTIGEEMAVAAVIQGAADYLLKDRITRLGPAVRRALKEIEERREHRQLEAQFIEAQKMQVVGHLAAGVAHDFNNILSIIMGYSDMIAESMAVDSGTQQYLNEVRLATTRAVGLTQQLLLFSRKQSVQAVVVDLNEVVKGAENMLARLIDENIEMSITCDETTGPIKADSGYLGQVLMNLAVNARDAMPEGGKLTIRTSSVEIDEAFAERHPGMMPGHYALLSIADTGIGMSEETRSKIFEAFFTTKPVGKGTGLGLATCQTIVRLSNGYIDVRSELGVGSTFNIYFPNVKPSVSVPKAAHRSVESPRGTETILVVEDDPSVRHLAQSILTARGYEVVTAPNGQDALRVAREHQGEPISLVVSDLVMPRMGGKVMAEWLKSTYPDLKVLFTSGYTEEAVGAPDDVTEDIGFLPKPYTAPQLCQKVRELLDASP
jgi:two-component system cell cycle sensor histidine kinase/response regulator CckA